MGVSRHAFHSMQSLTLALLRMLGSSCCVALRRCVVMPALGTAAAMACIGKLSDLIGWPSVGGRPSLIGSGLRALAAAKGLSVVEGAYGVLNVACRLPSTRGVASDTARSAV